MSKSDRSRVKNSYGDGWEAGETTLFNYQLRRERDVAVRFKSGHEVGQLVQFGKPESQTAICSKTGRVFQQTNRYWVETERFVSKIYVENEVARFTAEDEAQLDISCWGWGWQ